MLEKIRLKLKKILLLDSSPSKIAAAAAVGVFIAFSPYIGFHTALAIGASFIFNLPFYPMILGAYITNPLTFVPIYTICYKIGAVITGEYAATPPSFKDMTMQSMLHTAKTFIIPFLAGTHLLGLIIGAITYILTYRIIIKYRGKV